MNKTKKFLIAIALIALSLFGVNKWLNSGSLQPDNTVWYEYIGQDTTVGLWPDIYANYFAYTYYKTKDNIGLKIRGTFPNTRYLSFNVYNIKDKTTQGSLIDAEIIAQQSFEIDDQSKRKKYELNILPKKYAELDLENKLVFADDAKMFLVVMRLYDFNEDNFGGVDLPSVQAYNLEMQDEFTPLRLPKGLNLRKFVSGPKIAKDIWFMYKSENLFPLDGPKDAKPNFKLPFYRIIGEGMIQNNDNLYLLSAVTKQENEVYILKFKAPSFVQKTEDIEQTEVRYWSVNIGDDLSYDFNAIKDEDCMIDSSGYVTIVIGEESPAIRSKCETLGLNFMEWNIPRDKGYIIYRNMLSSADFEGNIINVPALKDTGIAAFTNKEAGNYIGEYAPVGYRISSQEFLKTITF
ncbi:MAG: hypothetical protein ACJA01_003303 [Saprospiraceae bacterium]